MARNSTRSSQTSSGRAFAQGQPTTSPIHWTSLKHLKHLNPRKATGSDNIPAWCLKRYAEELAPVVHDIVVASIVQCKYPTSYKHAIISPIPKIRPPTDLDSDFRQVSVLPQLAKVIEKLQLQLNKSSFKIKTNQHAFTSGHSTVSALTSISQTGSTQQTTPQPVDKVSTPSLLISGRRLTWSTIRSFWTSLLI